jgi:glutamate synthase (NADPH/NADH) large chain
MSGGIAYVYDEDGSFARKCNTSMVSLEPVQDAEGQTRSDNELAATGKGRLRHADRADAELLRELVERHLHFTGSSRARSILDNWDAMLGKFVKVFPNEYKRALSELHAKQLTAKSASATERVAA